MVFGIGLLLYMWWNYIWHGLPIIGISSAETGLKPAKYSLLLASMYPFLNTFSVFSKISPQPSVLNLKIVRRKKRSSIYIYFPSTLKREKMTSNWILRPVRLLKFVPNWVWVDKSTNRGLGCTRSFPKVPTQFERYFNCKKLQINDAAAENSEVFLPLKELSLCCLLADTQED